MIKHLLIILFFCYSISLSQNNEYSTYAQIMGCDFDITIIHDDSTVANLLLKRALKEATKIENTISSWKKNSQTSLINRNAGIKPVIVDSNLFFLISRCMYMSKITDGYFDITYASLDKVWYFNEKINKFPTQKTIDSLKQFVNFRNIVLNKNNYSVYLENKGMKIGFGAIGKGYLAQHLKSFFIQNKIKNGVINAGGDLAIWGKNLQQNNWKISIANPVDSLNDVGILNLTDCSIVTSGNYKKFFYHMGKRYTHIINPKTGIPASGISSISIICPDSEMADALATACFVMGVNQSIQFINQLQSIEAIVVDDSGNIFNTEHININNE